MMVVQKASKSAENLAERKVSKTVDCWDDLKVEMLVAVMELLKAALMVVQ